MFILVFLNVIATVFIEAFTQKSSEAFLIFTEGCVIPNYPLIGEDIKHLVNVPRDATNCLKPFQLLNSNDSHIWVDDDALPFYEIFKLNEFYCCYIHFYANISLKDITYGNCLQFSTMIIAQHEFVKTECFYYGSKIHEEFFVFPKLKKIKASKEAKKFNVVIFGLESVSRMNFLRTMPRTAAFLRERESDQLLGYNKLGDNSFPNLFPLLMGQSFKNTLNKCLHNKDTGGSNACSYIWEKYKNAGYVTALGSDSPAGLLGTYEYNFGELPTDYYLQPLMYETRKLFHNQDYNYHLCAGNKFYHNILLDYIYGVSQNLKNNNLFGVFWEESVSHEHLNYPHLMDTQYAKLLLKLETSGFLNESVIIFLSDHGMRFGEIVQTEQGRLEERLPLLQVLFPPNFKKQYNIAYQNFKLNSNRLTTPYDIYYTLLDILNPALLNKDTLSKRMNRGLNLRKSSLFLPVSDSRTCAFVGISEHWCTCYRGEQVPVGRKTRTSAAQHLITYINDLLNSFPQCHELTLESILDVSVTGDSRGGTFRVVIQVSPGGGIFDGTLRRERAVWAVSGTVSRLNLYRGQSGCIKNNLLKMFCYCTAEH